MTPPPAEPKPKQSESTQSEQHATGAHPRVRDWEVRVSIFGSDDDVAWFHERIEAGVTYANRPFGATTGAWPGYQPFGGWKGSGSTGKSAGSLYYLTQYLREQSQTRVTRR